MAAALGAIAGLGQVASSGMDIAMPFIQQQWSQSASARQRHWEEMMYDTRYQRTVADMKAAGLNPILAATGGNVGGGSSASAIPGASGGRGSDIGSAVSKGLSTALQAKILKDTAGKIHADRFKSMADADTAATNADVARKWADLAAEYNVRSTNARADLDTSNALRNLYENDSTIARTHLLDAQRQMMRFGLPSAKARSEFDASPFGRRMNQVDRALEMVPGVNLFMGGVGAGAASRLMRNFGKGGGNPHGEDYEGYGM